MLAASAGRSRVAVDLHYRQVNGDPSVVLFTDGTPLAVMVLDLEADGEHVRDIYVVSNPDKLTSLDDPRREDGPRRPAR
ncbi:hypothetical protein ACIBH1_11505 [Nonomuraea sp. NPDC050663]|uniref:hypothetical protein n=1 Tax=Nonomuraea sp. NPDC050663 TaxID=3364370 RepID=UPI00378B4352